MRPQLIASLIWITTTIATPAPDLAVETAEEKNDSGERPDLPSDLKSYQTPHDDDGGEYAAEKRIDVAFQRGESSVAEFHASTGNDSIAEKNDFLVKSELYGRKTKKNATRVNRKNERNPAIYNVTEARGEKFGNDSDTGVFLVTVKSRDESVSNGEGNIRDGNASTSVNARNDDASLENARNVSRTATTDYDELGDESVLSEIIKSYEEIKGPFENVDNAVLNDTIFGAREKKGDKYRFSTGTFSRPIVVIEENYRDDKIDFNRLENKSSSFDKEMSTAESQRHKDLISSSMILSPLQVGIALMNANQNHIPEERKGNELQNDLQISRFNEESGKTETMLSDQPDASRKTSEKAEKSTKPAEKTEKSQKPVENTVEIQKSVELYHNAPITEIHYPVEYTAHVYPDHVRSNVLRNEIDSPANDRRREEIPVDGNFYRYSGIDGFASDDDDETEVTIVPQPTVYVHSVQERQGHRREHFDRRRIVPEELPRRDNATTSDEKAGVVAGERQEFALYRLPNLQIVYDRKSEQDARVAQESPGERYLQPYVVEYRKGLGSHDQTTQQGSSYQPIHGIHSPISQGNAYQAQDDRQSGYQVTEKQLDVYQPAAVQQNVYHRSETQQNVYQRPDTQQNIYQQVDNQENAYQQAETQQNSYQQVDNQQIIYPTPENQKNAYQLSENQKNAYQLSENQKNAYQLSEKQQNVYQLSDNQQIIYQQPERQQNIYQQPENQQNIYQPPENQQNIYQPHENQQNIYQPSEIQQNIYQPPENQPNIYQPAENQQNIYQTPESQQNVYQLPESQPNIYVPVKYNVERIREKLPGGSEDAASAQRFPAEKLALKGAPVAFQELLGLRQVPIWQEIIEQPFAVPLRLPIGPQFHRHVIVQQVLPETTLPLAIQRLPAYPARGSSRPRPGTKVHAEESTSGRTRTRARPQDVEKTSAKPRNRPEQVGKSQQVTNPGNAIVPTRYVAGQISNASNVLQLYDYVYEKPLFVKEHRPKPSSRRPTSQQFDGKEIRVPPPYFSLAYRPAALIHGPGASRKRQATIHGHAKSRSTPSDETTTGFVRRERAENAKNKQETGRNSIGNFRQSKMEYGFKPPMVPSVQYDEETAARVEN